MTNCAIFVFSRHTRSTKYKIQLQTILKLLQLYIHLTHCGNKYFTSRFMENTEPFFLHCSFHNVEKSNFTFHLVEISQSTFHIMKLTLHIVEKIDVIQNFWRNSSAGLSKNAAKQTWQHSGKYIVHIVLKPHNSLGLNILSVK